MMPLAIPRLDAEHDEIDAVHFLIREPVAMVAVGLERGMDAHRPGSGQQFDDEAMLHQRLAPADRQST
jgi:hypothetical protein